MGGWYSRCRESVLTAASVIACAAGVHSSFMSVSVISVVNKSRQSMHPTAKKLSTARLVTKMKLYESRNQTVQQVQGSVCH